MEIISKMLAGMLVLAVTNVYAAEPVTRAGFEKVESQYGKMGGISISNEMSTADAKEDLIRKANEEGTGALVLISGQTDSKTRSTTSIYKKK